MDQVDYEKQLHSQLNALISSMPGLSQEILHSDRMNQYNEIVNLLERIDPEKADQLRMHLESNPDPSPQPSTAFGVSQFSSIEMNMKRDSISIFKKETPTFILNNRLIITQ